MHSSKMGAPLCFFLAMSQAVLGAPTSTTRADNTVAYVPIPDQHVDRNSLINLAPTWKPLLAAQEPSGRNLTIALDTAYPVIILENSAHIAEYECGGPKSPSITVQFDSAEALKFAIGWPRQDLILLTSHEGCNAENKRGVYLTQKTVFDHRGFKATFSVQQGELKDVARTMTVHFAGDETNIRKPRLAELKKRAIDEPAN